jgi:hypothetical protein
VQQRREFPTRVVQAIQARAHHAMARKIFDHPGPLHVPWQFRLALNLPSLRRVVARGVALGVRPEHVGTNYDDGTKRLRRAAILVGVTTAFVAAVFLRRLRQ